MAGDKKGDGTGNKEGNDDQLQQHKQLLRQSGWRAFGSGDEEDGANATAARVTTGEREMMVAMGHGLCVCFGLCGETTKNECILILDTTSQKRRASHLRVCRSQKCYNFF